MRGLILVFILGMITLTLAEEFRERKHVERWFKVTDEDVRAEILLGREVAANILGKYKFVDNESLNIYINKVGKYLAMFSGRGELEFRFAVIDSEEVNAFSTPGGYIFITTGALRQIKNEAELAGILAHEIGHVAGMHVIEDLNVKGSGKSSKSLILILSGGTQVVGATFAELIDKATDILLERGFRHDQELEADRIGVVIMTMAGYDPSAYIEFLERVDYESKTHPKSDERIKEIRKIIKEMGVFKGKRLEDRYLENVNLH